MVEFCARLRWRRSRRCWAGERPIVVIIGAGYTGLWTAHYLKQHDPQLDIAIVEAQTAGYGASGRNGGWAIGSCAGLEGWLEEPGTRNLRRSAWRVPCKTR